MSIAFLTGLHFEDLNGSFVLVSIHTYIYIGKNNFPSLEIKNKWNIYKDIYYLNKNEISKTSSNEDKRIQKKEDQKIIIAVAVLV